MASMMPDPAGACDVRRCNLSDVPDVKTSEGGTMQTQTSDRVIVVGGGIAGLAAAALVARGGRPVTLLERSTSLGGRGMTQTVDGFQMNLGPHALYRAGAGIEVLRSLGIDPQGGVPPSTGGHGVAGGVLHTLPAGLVSLLTTGLLRTSSKLEFGQLLGKLQRIDTDALQRTTLSEWLERTVRHADARQVLQGVFRLSTYADDTARHSAGAALHQLKLALRAGVLYLHGGWQTLVDGLRTAAESAGVRIVTGAKVAEVEQGPTIRLGDGTREPASAVILAVGPGEAAAMVRSPALDAIAGSAVPVRAACLDVGLSRLPKPKSIFALGIDRPLYLSVHSAVARLAPAGQTLIHVAKYLKPGASNDPRADERELERLLDLVQTGWRDALVTRRFLPSMTVTSALVTASAGGLPGRPAPAVPGVANVYVAGDWVGPEGMLVDASLASARRAAALVGGATTRIIAAA
jgi:phytoene dehydrogenase-like protein